jgi:ribosomal protein S18 acetylase RimI-like enzyme
MTNVSPQTNPAYAQVCAPQPRHCAVRELNENDRDAALKLLAAEPLRGVHIQSLIEDYGVCSPALRGRFFGYFAGERLAGVALMGHQVMICAPDAALPLFAWAAVGAEVKINLIFGPRAQIEAFADALAARGVATTAPRDFYWYVCEQPRVPMQQMQMQQASLAHLEMVEEAHAQMFREATGNDPRERDAEGFRRRVRERIEHGRTWVKIEGGQIVFKAELQNVTTEAIYLEGIWTHPAWRGRGLAKRCMVELTHRRLRRRQALCLVVEPDEVAAQRVYQHAGFEYSGDYQARYAR